MLFARCSVGLEDQSLSELQSSDVKNAFSFIYFVYRTKEGNEQEEKIVN